jgi:hypothetical protein
LNLKKDGAERECARARARIKKGNGNEINGVVRPCSSLGNNKVAFDPTAEKTYIEWLSLNPPPNLILRGNHPNKNRPLGSRPLAMGSFLKTAGVPEHDGFFCISILVFHHGRN